jgi:dolichyl-phosphate beta-glucosyltransferase
VRVRLYIASRAAAAGTSLGLPSHIELVYPQALPAGSAAPAVSVVIPAYNEAERIEPYLDAIQRYFTDRGERYEVLVVDDGSRDDTAGLVRGRMARDHHLGLVCYGRNRGKGHAVRMGMLAARGELRLFADADGSTPIAELERLRSAIAAGASVAIGSRALSSTEVQRVVKPHRWLLGQCFRGLRMLFLQVGVIDSQCGFKLFTARAATELFGAARIDGFAFDVEILFLAVRAGLRIREVPVNWFDAPSTRVNLWIHPMQMLRDTVRIQRLHRDRDR